MTRKEVDWAVAHYWDTPHPPSLHPRSPEEVGFDEILYSTLPWRRPVRP